MIDYYPRIIIDLDNKINDDSKILIPDQEFDKFRQYCLIYSYNKIKEMKKFDISDIVRKMPNSNDQKINLFAGKEIGFIVIILADRNDYDYTTEIEKIKEVTEFENKKLSMQTRYLLLTKKFLNISKFLGLKKCWQFIFPFQKSNGTIPSLEEYEEIKNSFLISLILLKRKNILNQIIGHRNETISVDIQSNYYDSVKLRRKVKPYIVKYNRNKLIMRILEQSNNEIYQEDIFITQIKDFRFNNVSVSNLLAMKYEKIPFFAKKNTRKQTISNSIDNIVNESKAIIRNNLKGIYDLINGKEDYNLHEILTSKIHKIWKDKKNLYFISNFLEKQVELMQKKTKKTTNWSFIHKCGEINISSYPWNIWWLLLTMLVSSIPVYLFVEPYWLCFLPLIAVIGILMHSYIAIKSKTKVLHNCMRKTINSIKPFFEDNLEKVLTNNHTFQRRLLLPYMERYQLNYNTLILNYHSQLKEEFIPELTSLKSSLSQEMIDYFDNNQDEINIITEIQLTSLWQELQNPREFAKTIENLINENSSLRNILDRIVTKFYNPIAQNDCIELRDNNLYNYNATREDLRIGDGNLEPIIKFEAVLKICPIVVRRTDGS